MSKNRHIVLYHWPHSRSAGVQTLLEELNADYKLEIVDIREGKQRKTDFIRINPQGKLPTIEHAGSVVTEQTAVYIYLADLYADRGLAPAIDDALRGPYLSWMAFYGSCFEPAIVDKSLKREPPPISMSPYGNFDMVWNRIVTQLKEGPYLLGEKFLAIDVLWGASLTWMDQFGLTEKVPAVQDYLQRVNARSHWQKVRADNARIMERYP